MSNSAVVSHSFFTLLQMLAADYANQGTLYKRIIDQVIDSSKADFEENGVNSRMIQTFQEVRKRFRWLSLDFTSLQNLSKVEIYQPESDPSGAHDTYEQIFSKIASGSGRKKARKF